MRRAATAAERPRLMTLEGWAALDDDVEGVLVDGILGPQLRSIEVYELDRDRRYTVAASAAHGRVRVPGCPGLTLDLDALWTEVEAAERAHARTSRRR